MIRVDVARAMLLAFGQQHRCVIGRGGAIAADAKREGDGATPLGRWPIQGALLRPDRIEAPSTSLPWRWMRPDDGWSDDPADPCYNRPVSHPHRFGAERLWRDDHVYDIIILLGHNISPVIPGAGSAIFWHIARPDDAPTQGCVAIESNALTQMLGRLEPGIVLEIA